MAGKLATTILKELSGTAFDTEYNSGSTVPRSGIYKCKNCGREITSNAHPSDNTFPPHNSTSNCKNAKWKLHIVTDTLGDNFKSVIG
ncbi:protein L [Acinetobacter guillouiae]|uniref:protein L n=1 Tax=Acinetobacter guillouiae TaxID=106649 RepID=UPI003AF50AB8